MNQREHACTHLDAIAVTEPPEEIAGCEDCLRAGPIIRSAEPGDDRSWCYVDDVAFVVEPDQT